MYIFVGLMTSLWGCSDKEQVEDSDSATEIEPSDEAAFITEALDCSPDPGNGVGPGEDLRKVTLDAQNAI